uniref:Uncharacterized protein n=1 Tax=Salix viminalis TaxID=40686 RepID=A0A6N2MRB3_SALVM
MSTLLHTRRLPSLLLHTRRLPYLLLVRKKPFSYATLTATLSSNPLSFSAVSICTHHRISFSTPSLPYFFSSAKTPSPLQPSLQPSLQTHFPSLPVEDDLDSPPPHSPSLPDQDDLSVISDSICRHRHFLHRRPIPKQPNHNRPILLLNHHKLSLSAFSSESLLVD